MYKLPSKLKNYRQRYILVFTLSNVLAKYFGYIRCLKFALLIAPTINPLLKCRFSLYIIIFARLILLKIYDII